MKKRNALFLAAIAVTLLMPGCPDVSNSIESPVLRTIGDAAHDGPTDNFYFLPPMVDCPEFSGVFDPEVSPLVSIPSLNLVFTMDSGHGSERIRVCEDNEHYIVNWHTKRFGLQSGDVHRILFLVDGFEIGFVDVQIVEKGKDVASVDEGLYVAVKNGRTLPIKFRIETGTPVTGVLVDPTELELFVEETAQLTATVEPPEATDPSISWTSSDDSVALVDETGLVTALARGSALITVTTSSGGHNADCAVTVSSKPLDAFVVNYNQPSTIWVNDGDAIFSLNQALIPPGRGSDVELGDLDNDGDLDAYVANLGRDEVWMNSSGVFELKSQSAPPPPLDDVSSNGVALGFIDSDEFLDAVTAYGNYCYFMTGNGDGTFTQQQILTQGGSAHDVALGDLDGDGDLDLVTAMHGTCRYWIYQDGFYYQAGHLPRYAVHTDVKLHDLDDDGDLDVVVAVLNLSDNEVWLNQTPVTETPSTIIFTGPGYFGYHTSSVSLSLGDFDNDSYPDVLIVNQSDPGEVWFNNGSGRFINGAVYSMTSGSRDVALGDLDDDGDLDAYFARHGSYGNIVMLNNGSGVFIDSLQSLGNNFSFAVALAPLLH